MTMIVIMLWSALASLCPGGGRPEGAACGFGNLRHGMGLAIGGR
jgi:hypothetical protein